MKVVLYQPKIPQNAGNVVRTCAVTGSDLVLVTPLGFSTASRHLKRAGLDYWEGVNVEIVNDLTPILEQSTAYFFSSKATKFYTEIDFKGDELLIFGSEDAGLPEKFWKEHPSQFYKLPMRENVRCLNLAVSVGIVLYEAIRQTGILKGPQKPSCGESLGL